MITVSSATAAERKIYDPSNGILFNTKEDHSLTFKCEKVSEDVLKCDFVQVSVRKKLRQEDAAEKLAEAMTVYDKDKAEEIDKEICALASKGLAALKEKAPMPKEMQGVKLNGLAKKDLLEQFQGLELLCRDPSRSNYENLVKIGQSKDARTCEIASNRYSQQFNRVVNPKNGRSTWVVNSEPQGACGIVQLSRFEMEPDEDLFWKYVARKAITNPQAESEGLIPLKCSMFDESQYEYDWRERELALGCDYIDFEPL